MKYIYFNFLLLVSLFLNSAQIMKCLFVSSVRLFAPGPSATVKMS